jgi:hypothetical protein
MEDRNVSATGSDEVHAFGFQQHPVQSASDVTPAFNPTPVFVPNTAGQDGSWQQSPPPPINESEYSSLSVPSAYQFVGSDNAHLAYPFGNLELPMGPTIMAPHHTIPYAANPPPIYPPTFPAHNAELAPVPGGLMQQTLATIPPPQLQADYTWSQHAQGIPLPPNPK